MNSQSNTVSCLAIDEYSGVNINKEVRIMRDAVYKLKMGDTTGLPYLLGLALGYPYMATSNLVNGAVGYLKYIEYNVYNPTVIKRL